MDQETVGQIVSRMGRFAATTTNDALSVAVAAAARRLHHQGTMFEKRLTEKEMAIIRPFLNEREDRPFLKEREAA